MSGYYDTAPAPPQTHAIISAAADLLRADTADLMMVIDYVYDQRIPLERDDVPFRFIVVREPVRPGFLEPQNRIRNLLFDVVVFAHEETKNVDTFLSGVHARVFELLVGQTLSTSTAGIVLPTERRNVPTPALYDPSDHSYTSAATFATVIKPNGV